VSIYLFIQEEKMKKKAKISLLITVVFAGLLMFAYSEVAAQQPPTDSTRIITCPGEGVIKMDLDANTGDLTDASWCDESDYNNGECDYWQPMTVHYTGVVCYDFTSSSPLCRELKNAELWYACGTGLTGLGNKYFTR
jgi:hypothetical protein